MAGGPVTVEVQGADEVAATMKQCAHDLADMSDANRQAADIFVEASRPMAPHRTGRLASATFAQWEKDSAGFVNDEPYFGPIHYGWPAHNIEAQPFVDEATDATTDQWMAVYRDAVTAACDEVQGV